MKEAPPGSVSWTLQGRYAQLDSTASIDKKTKDEIQKFSPLVVDFVGSRQSGESTDIGLTILVRAPQDAVAGAVIGSDSSGKP
jgi:hypothetical protein